MDTTPNGSDDATARRDQRVNDVVARILARSGTALASTSGQDHSGDAGELEREARAGTRRVDTGASDRDDISEVEYRQVRLEKVVLVGLRTTQSEEEAENSLRELAALAETAGSRVLDGIIQRRSKPDPATYLGSGKARELAEIVRAVEADTVIVNEELAPSQRRGLEDVVDAKVVDRTALILDIFAQHAKSREGKAQVELAQLEYLLPRLRGWGESMSRQAGGRVAGGAGIGSRGPGETKIELDRRRIRTRMAKLKADIARMEPARRTQRQSRRRGAVPSVAIAGYTNAGKSTLLNRLTDAGVLVQDALFATLDPTVRRARAADGREYTLTDTVGFVRNLPTQLVEAFRSTLEEVGQADLIVHVVDAAHPDPVSQVQAVRSVIDTIEGAILRGEGRSGLPRGDEGYVIGYELASDQLDLGLDVVVECVNPIATTRDAWLAVGDRARALVIEVELVCSDVIEHRRLETREIDVVGITNPRWREVIDRDYERWERDRLVIDTSLVRPDAAARTVLDEVRRRRASRASR